MYAPTRSCGHCVNYEALELCNMIIGIAVILVIRMAKLHKLGVDQSMIVYVVLA